MHLRLANPSDSDSITRLRINAYQRATGSILLDPNAMAWHETDRCGQVLLIEDAGEIVSTICTHWVTERRALESMLDVRLGETVPLPAAVISRGATAISHRRRGLIAVTRLFLIRAALKHGAGSVVSTVQADAFRLPAMREIGYQVSTADVSHRTAGGKFLNSSDVMLTVLPRDRMRRAVAVAEAMLVTRLHEFQISDDVQDLQLGSPPGFVEELSAC